jgi:putative flippase GtrA
MNWSTFQALAKAGPTIVPDASIMTTASGVQISAGPPLICVGPSGRQQSVDVEIVVPVYNEETSLAGSVGRLHRYLSERFPLGWLITVADNASTDSTWGIACRLTKELDRTRAVHLEQKGRGRALRATWMQSTATVVAYMDVDLSTDLDALLPLVAPLVTGHSDLAIGSRLARGARVVRGPKREVISRIYNFILRATLNNSFSDAQCGFKAARTDIARQLLPLVTDNGWFFDTELLVLAERNGLRVHEVAVDWVDNPDSTVDIVRTAKDDLKGVARMMLGSARGTGVLDLRSPGARATGARATAPRRRRSPAPGVTGQLVHFCAVGLASTLAFALLFCLLYGALGAFGADIVALGLCSLGNLAANRRFTFSNSNFALASPGSSRYFTAGLVLGLLPLAATLVALAATTAAGISDLGVDLLVLTAANLTSSAARFQFLRRSVAYPRAPGTAR